MRFGKGFFRGASAATLVCSLSVGRKFREGLTSISHATWVKKKRPGHPYLKDSQVSTSPTTLLLYHPDLDLGVDVGVQPDGNAIDSERADGLVKVDLPLLDDEALRLELVRNVR
jgi:hypothetical protein